MSGTNVILTKIKNPRVPTTAGFLKLNKTYIKNAIQYYNLNKGFKAQLFKWQGFLFKRQCFLNKRLF